jgi:hypothetical protein
LTEIQNKAKVDEITRWKNLPCVASCYKNLYKKIDDTENSPNYMDRIIEIVWPKTEVLDLHAAWAVSIAEVVLDPNNGEIKISEETIEPLLEKNLVSFYKILFNFE